MAEGEPVVDTPDTADETAPENYEAWANTAKSRVGNAQSVMTDLFAALEGTDFVHAESPKLGNSGRPRNVDKGPKHQTSMDARLEVTKNALDSDEASGQRCQQILTLLTHERQRKWAALKVVEWRLALRERRPPQELFRDHLQDSLEQELKTLENSRKILADRAAEVKVAVQDCEANKVKLIRNVRYLICAGQLTAPPPLRDAASSSTLLPGSPFPEAAEAAAVLEEAVSGDAMPDEIPVLKRPDVPTTHEGLMKRAPILHEYSMKLFFQGEKLIETQRKVCERANQKVMASFKKRNAENKDMRINLEAQMREMDEAMVSADKCVTRMNKDITFFAKVELQPRVDATLEMIEKIKAAKIDLESDCLRKVVSMRIDDCCRKITADRTGQDPNSMPVAALLEGSGTKSSLPKGRPKRPQSQQGSPSSQAFASGSIDSAPSTPSGTMLFGLDSMASTATTMPVRPASPAGISSPLKAAAAASGLA